MRVFKFGGASIKDAASVKNVVEVLKLYEGEDIAVVVSAMGKTTNALERVAASYFNKDDDTAMLLDEVREFHNQILRELFQDNSPPVYADVNSCIEKIAHIIESAPDGTYDFIYDQIVPEGEMMSTRIISAYLNDASIKNQWMDVREFLITDDHHREANVDWKKTETGMNRTLLPVFNVDREKAQIVVTQGFVGATSEGKTTTLGREGSDYTAAIIAYVLNADDVTIWKDVPGVLNADPKWFDLTEKLLDISYREAIELAYNGATIIHPKTIKPLQNKGILLRVKSFLSPEERGTRIYKDTTSDSLIPSFIFMMNQVLISISPRDFSFIIEENLSDIFRHFAKHKVKVNMMQNSAINFSVSTDNDTDKIPKLIKALKKDYKVLYNEDLELVTIRHYDYDTIEKVTTGKEILLEQRSRHTVRMVMKDLGWFKG